MQDSKTDPTIVTVHVPGSADPVDVIVALVDSAVQALEAIGADPAAALEAAATSYRKQQQRHDEQQAQPVAVPEHGDVRYRSPGGVA